MVLEPIEHEDIAGAREPGATSTGGAVASHFSRPAEIFDSNRS